MYLVLDSAFRHVLILLHEEKCISLNKKYSDLNLTPNEISCFFSGLFFNTTSNFVYTDNHKDLSAKDILSKNNYFNTLGKSLGLNGEVGLLISELVKVQIKNPKEKITIESFGQQWRDICSFSAHEVSCFCNGFNKKLNYNPTFSDSERILCLTGWDLSNKEIFKTLSRIIFS